MASCMVVKSEIKKLSYLPCGWNDKKSETNIYFFVEALSSMIATDLIINELVKTWEQK